MTEQAKKGGARPGAGRPKGSSNKRTVAERELKAKAAAKGKTPLEFMLAIMHNSKRPMAERMDMAKAAAPYMHARLQAIEHSGPDGGSIPVATVTRVIVKPS